MAHHREEFGPNEPDIPLYANKFLQIASLDPERYLIVDGTQSIDDIHEEIISRVGEIPALKRNSEKQTKTKRRAKKKP
jgi:dTMP kinase